MVLRARHLAICDNLILQPNQGDVYLFENTGITTYLKLVRSMRDGAVFDLVPEVAARYLSARRSCRKLRFGRSGLPWLWFDRATRSESSLAIFST